jgi:DNA-binding CsgD family transcriptional regulator
VLPRPAHAGAHHFSAPAWKVRGRIPTQPRPPMWSPSTKNPRSGLYEQSALRRWDRGSVRKGNRLELSPLAKTRESPCPRRCRVCFLARKYGLTPREVNLIALISSGQSSRAMSKIMGIGITTIRECCRTIHRKIGTHSRLAIGLWAIREGMVKSAIQP